MNLRATAIGAKHARRIVIPYGVLRALVHDYSFAAFGVGLPSDAEIYGVRDEDPDAGGQATVAVEVRSPTWGEVSVTPVLDVPAPRSWPWP